MIEIRGLTKSYRTRHGRHYVFRDVNAVIPPGKNVAILGPNGAGKSTLLRLLGGIDFPDAGEVRVRGSVSWPVGLTGGFQGSLSGRDNVRFVCRIHGLDEADMKERIRFVEEFAELEEYFDQPVNSYSAGMRSRLGFGLSMAFDFDYYLIDEIMAVGDKSFVNKSKEVFQARTRDSHLIIASHNLPQLRTQCQVGVFVEGGKIEVYADIREAFRRYNEFAGVPAPVPGQQALRRPTPGAVTSVQPGTPLPRPATAGLRQVPAGPGPRPLPAAPAQRPIPATPGGRAAPVAPGMLRSPAAAVQRPRAAAAGPQPAPAIAVQRATPPVPGQRPAPAGAQHPMAPGPGQRPGPSVTVQRPAPLTPVEQPGANQSGPAEEQDKTS